MSNIERSKEKPLSETKVNLPAKGPEALSSKPSTLIRQAMRDLEAAERSPRHKVNMGVWHCPIDIDVDGGSCTVCMAGSVMAGTLECSPVSAVMPNEDRFRDSHHTHKKLEALNMFRLGAVASGVLSMCPEISDELESKAYDIKMRMNEKYAGVQYPDMEPFERKSNYLSSPEWQRERRLFGERMMETADELEKIGL